MLITKQKTKQISVKFDVKDIEFMEQHGKKATIAKFIVSKAIENWDEFERLFCKPT